MEPIGWIHSTSSRRAAACRLKLTYNGKTSPSLCKSESRGLEHMDSDEIRACFRIQEIEPLFAALPNGTTTVTLTLEGD